MAAGVRCVVRHSTPREAMQPLLPEQVEEQQRDSVVKRSDKLPDTVTRHSWVTGAPAPALLLGWRGWAQIASEPSARPWRRAELCATVGRTAEGTLSKTGVLAKSCLKRLRDNSS